MDLEAAKRSAAEAALAHVDDGMTLGLGTGSTAKHFIDLLGEKIRDGWTLAGVPTSEETRRLAIAAGVEMIEPDETTMLDVAVDGADEADPALNLIKGGGGALLREKIVAAASKKFIVIADKTKRVATLGKFPLPIEIETFAWPLTVRRLREALADAGYAAPKLTLRGGDGAAMTDGGNYILDCALERIDNPAALHDTLIVLPGVVETGLFCGMADLAIFGGDDGVTVDKPAV